MLGKKVSYIEVEYGDLEELVREVYGDNDYSFVATEECGNDSKFKFKVNTDVSGYDLYAENSIRNGKVPNYTNGLVLNMLCKDGHIEAGDYLINVCW